MGLANISGRDLNMLMDRVEALTGFRGINTVTTGSHYAIKHDAPRKFLAKITDREQDPSSGVYYYSWVWVEKFSDNSYEEVTEGPLGDADNIPLFELNDAYLSVGTIVEANWTEDNFVWCAYGGGGGGATASDCGPGCGWVAGLRTDQCVRLSLLEASGLCTNDAPDVNELLCYEDAVSAWTEDGCLTDDGSGAEPDPWWCLDGECIQSATSPGVGATEHATYGECATACSITGTFGDDCEQLTQTPASFSGTLSGFGGVCGPANGSITLTQTEWGPCDFESGDLGSGITASMQMEGGGYPGPVLTIYDSDGLIIATYQKYDDYTDGCSPLTLVLNYNGCGGSAPASITLEPSC